MLKQLPSFLVLGHRGDLHDRVVDRRSTVQGTEPVERGGQRVLEGLRPQRFPRDDVTDCDRHVLGCVVARARDQAVAVRPQVEDLHHSVGRRPPFHRDLGVDGIAQLPQQRFVADQALEREGGGPDMPVDRGADRPLPADDPVLLEALERAPDRRPADVHHLRQDVLRRQALVEALLENRLEQSGANTLG